MSRTASEYLIEALGNKGVKRITGVAGDPLDGFADTQRGSRLIISGSSCAAALFQSAPHDCRAPALLLEGT